MYCQRSCGMDDAQLLSAYYRAWSCGWVDQAQLEAVIDDDAAVLWLGSYLDIALPWITRNWVITDLSAEMLRAIRQQLPCNPVVQADIRQLPFHACFDTAIVLGAVTAYLLDDDAVARAASSLRCALVHDTRARIMLDAYDMDTIHSTRYFNGQGAWQFNGSQFTHSVKTSHLPDSQGIFDATLKITRIQEGTAKSEWNFTFRQRAFLPNQLGRLFEAQGLRMTRSHRDPARGRFYQVYVPEHEP